MERGGSLAPSMINETFEQFRAEVAAWLKDLHRLIREIDNAELDAVISDMRAHVTEPFLFVVVGEIKAGKSSFINALLGAPICAVDPAPCTDVVQELVFAPEKSEAEVSPHLRRIGLPVDILQQIAIVDTPGTNTIIKHHHDITERFIPNSGLVLFVFPAKNPHTLSAWELLDFVKEEWRRRVVFVLQQADLASEEELHINRQKVVEYAHGRGISEPTVFVTSAKWEENGDPRSGFDEIRRFIRDTVTGGRHYTLKLVGILESGEQVLKKVYDAFQMLQQQLETDRAVAARMARLLDKAGTDTDKDVRFLIDRLLEQFDRIAIQTKSDFEAGLSVGALYKRAFSGAFRKKKSVRGWLEDLQKQFEDRTTVAFEDIVNEGAAHFQRAMRRLADDLAEALGDAETAGGSLPVPVKDIGEKREDMVREMRDKVRELASTEFVDQVLAANPDNLPSRLMSGSALTLVGVVLLTTHITFLDITGGILTGLGMFMAGGVLMARKSRIVKEFNKALLESRDRFEEQLTGRLTTKFGLLLEQVRRQMEPFFENIRSREETIAPLMADGQTLQERLVELNGQLAPYNE